MNRSRVAILVFASLCGGALAIGLALDTGQTLLLSRGGVIVRTLDPADLPTGPKVQAQADDLELASDSVRLVVGASKADAERRLFYGVILDATSSTWSADALRSMRTVLRVGDQVVEPSVFDVRAAVSDGVPVIDIHARAHRERLELVTRIRITSGSSQVSLTSIVKNESGRTIRNLRFGDRISWPGGPSFAPGIGDIETNVRTELSWFGRRAPDIAYALAYPAGPVTLNFLVSARATNQTAWSEPTVLEPGEQSVFRRTLIVSWRGLADAAAAAYDLVGREVGYVVGRLDPPSPQALLTAVASDGTIGLKAFAEEDGSFRLPLPPGRYMLLLRTAGGVTETLVDVIAGRESLAKLDVPTAGILRFRVTDSSDSPMPARLILKGLGSTSDPDFGPDYRASSARNEVHSATGVGEIEAPPGRYAVTVTRGPEYSVVKRTVDVDAGRGAVLSVILVHEVDTEGWIAGDFHVHAAPSMDSEVSLADRVASLAAAGIEYAAATDHNEVTDYSPAIQALRLDKVLGSAVGVEITTADWGHFNAYPLRPDSDVPPYAGVAPATIFEAVRSEEPGALVQVNHPWMAGYGYFHRATLDEATTRFAKQGFSFAFDAIEVINGFELKTADALDNNLKRWFALLASGRRYAAMGNSDSHRVAREWAGYPRTYVQVADDRPESVSAQEIAESIRMGRTIVSNGIFVNALVGGVGPGGTVEVPAGEIEVSVQVRAADWIDVKQAEIVFNGEVVDVLPMSTPWRGDVRLERTAALDATRSGFLVVVVRGERSLEPLLPGMGAAPFAFTGPIYVEVLGQPRRAVEHEPMPVSDALAPATLVRDPEELGVDDLPDAQVDQSEVILLDGATNEGSAPLR